MINCSVLCRLSLISIDVNNLSLTEVELRNIRLLEQLSEGTGIWEGLGHSVERLNQAAAYKASRAGLHVVDSGPAEKALPSQDPKKAQGRAPPGSGSVEVTKVAEADHTHGIRWYFDATALSAKYRFPNNRMDRVTYATFDSNKYSYTTLKCVKGAACVDKPSC